MQERTTAAHERDYLAARFEENRGHLRAVAYRMLGSVSEAEDAVQEAWLRMDRTDTTDVDNLGGWLTTVVGRVCLDQLRRRASRREEPLDGSPTGYGEAPVRVPEPVLGPLDPPPGPEQDALIADSVGLALLVVLEQLAPAERLAFVLHDMFGMPFEEIAPVVDRTPAATRQLASRARRRVRGGAPTPDADLAVQREAVSAFLAASREGDFEGLLTVLDPDVLLRVDLGPGSGGASKLLRGAAAVARQALTFAKLGALGVPAMVNGAPGVVTMPGGKPGAVLGFTVSGGRIVEIDILADPERLARLDLTFLDA
ncbi:sigma-70 family RNA polymerase sigma factor [Streptomyces sp. NPDC002073]|uniref:sigma-70 family RNA polymerase sigma factor n=1 Tax=Streptomyces sp. NBC_00239 TaxID=2903640 RepID=UPI002E29DA26|nr:sigma-70 family RNA polymerase sigma factor [Streptomyces sp. NBC_00239]